MDTSQCDCLVLSTPNTSKFFTSPGDFSSKNSTAIFCSNANHEMCIGVMNSDLNDNFNCAKVDYDRKEVPSRGFGNECTSLTGEITHLSFGLAIAFIYYCILINRNNKQFYDTSKILLILIANE